MIATFVRPLVVAFMFACLTGAVHAAGFDCAKASTSIEKLICEDDELSKLDDALAAAYDKAKSASSEPAHLTRSQRAWLVRRNACRDRLCIKTAYERQLEELRESRQTEPPATAASAKDVDAELCSALVGPKRAKIQLDRAIPLTEDERSLIAKNVREHNNDLDVGYVEEKYRIDIDNDGKLENVVITVGPGSAKARGLLVYDDEWKLKSYEWVGFDFTDDYVRWAEQGSIVRFKGRTFVIAFDSSREFMRYASVYEKNVHRLLCKIGYAARAVETVFRASDSRLCRAVLAGKISYASFDHSSALRGEGCYQSGGPDCANYGGEVALIDIDNDGKAEHVVRLGVYWGGGRGCDFDFLAIPNAAGDDIVLTGTGKLLVEATVKWDACGGATSKPFRYRGTWYVENKYPDGHAFAYHNVVLIRDGRAREVCEFGVHRQPYLCGERSSRATNACDD